MTPATPLELLQPALPEIIIAISGLAALALDLTLLKRSSRKTRWNIGALVGFAGCVAAILLLVLRPEHTTLYDDMLVVNPLSQLVQTVLAAFTILTLLLSIGSEFTIHIGEYVAVVLFATAGMMVLASTQNLLVIFASLELLSICLYILTAFNKHSRQSAEAALKYFLFGGMAAAFLLFGISLLYGLSGTIELPAVAASLQWNPPAPLLLIAIVMIVTGFGFKVAAAPFHLWAPDAYQGAPTPSAALIASSSKIASFFVFAVVLAVGITATSNTPHAPGWTPLIEAVAAISMLLGNLAAIVQKSVRRLLAYSAIGHAGYMLLGILMNNAAGIRALLYYVITYALATIGAFGLLAALEKEGVDQLSDFAGLSRRAPLLSFCMLIFLLSLAGIPPLAGFFGKFYIFSSAFAARSSLLWLVALAIAMSAVSLYYYLRVLKQIYVREPATTTAPVHTPYIAKATVGLIALLVAVLGLCPNLLLDWINGALRSMPR